MLQATLLRHRLQRSPLCADGLLVVFVLLGSGDLLCSGPDLLHRFHLLCDSCGELLLGFCLDVLCRSRSDLLCTGSDLLHRSGELLCRSGCLSGALPSDFVTISTGVFRYQP